MSGTRYLARIGDRSLFPDLEPKAFLAHAAVSAPSIAVRRAVELGKPIDLVWARRGLLNEAQGLYDEQRLAALGVPDEVAVTPVDANHYDVILDGPGVEAISDGIDRHLGLTR